VHARRTVAVLFATLCILGCDDEPDVLPGGAPGAPAAKDPGLTDAMAAEFGAAGIVPESCSYFSSTLRLNEQWALVRDSRAVALLMELPAVQAGLAALTGSPQWAEFQRMRAEVPEVALGLEVLADACSQEFFVCFDERWPAVVDALASLYLQTTLSSFLPGPNAMADTAVGAVLDRANELRVPGALVGFRLRDPARARKLLDAVLPRLPVPLAKEEIGGGTFHTLRLDAQAIPRSVRRDLNRSLSQMGVGFDRVDSLNAWLNQQTLAIAVGVRGDYLLLSVGADTAQLAALGGKSSLARSKAFAPVRRRFRPGVCSLNYLCADLTGSGKIDVDAARGAVDGLLAWFGDVPAGLPERLRKDVAGLVEDVNTGLPAAHEEVTISFLERGIESYTFGAVVPSMDASRPLSILKSAGPAPLLAVAGRTLSSKETYDRFAHWCRVGWGYFQEYAVPRMSRGDRKEFDRFQASFVTAIVRFHEATKSKLIPALDATQALFVLDRDGTAMVPIASAPLRYPRPAIVLEIRDAAQLRSAFAEYRDATNALLEAVAKENPDLEHLRIPVPRSRAFAGGTLFDYALPIPPELDLQPHAVVTGDRAVLAIHEDHSAALLKPSPLPGGGVIDFGKPAGAACWVDIAGITEMLVDDADLVLRQLALDATLDARTANVVIQHVPVARKVLGVFKSYASRTWIEGDTSVTHSWLHVEDVPR